MHKRVNSIKKSEKPNTETASVSKPTTTIDQFFAVDKKKNEHNIERVNKNNCTQSADFYKECLSNIIKKNSNEDSCTDKDTNAFAVKQERKVPSVGADATENYLNISNNSGSYEESCRNIACGKEVRFFFESEISFFSIFKFCFFFRFKYVL